MYWAGLKAQSRACQAWNEPAQAKPWGRLHKGLGSALKIESLKPWAQAQALTYNINIILIVTIFLGYGWLCACDFVYVPQPVSLMFVAFYYALTTCYHTMSIISSVLPGLVSLPFGPHIQVQLGSTTISKSDRLLLPTLIDHTSICNPIFLDSDIKNGWFFGLNAYHSTISEHIACFHQNYNSKSCVWFSLGIKVWAGCVGSKEGWFSGAMVW